MRTKRWTVQQLGDAVKLSTSFRQVLGILGLIPAGGNYVQIQRAVKMHGYDTNHFTGKGWSRGKIIPREPVYTTKQLLVKKGTFQSHKLKKRLFADGLKQPQCELCGWAELSKDGRVPLELDHINGDRYDNRLVNLRILCPNCHSLQPTHRGRNMRRRDGVIGSRV